MAITVEARTEIIALVVGMFGAAPGASVLSDLVAAKEAGMTLKGIAASISNTNEFKSIYPSFLTNGEFATQLVNNLVGSLVASADKAAAATQVGAMLTAGASRSSVVVDVIAALNSVPSTHTVWGNAALAFDNKVDVATYYSVDKKLSGTSLQQLQNVIGAVTNTAASVTTAKGSIDNVGNPGGTFSFTVGVDALTGGSGDDVFNAVVTATSATLGGLDAADGGTGNDTLNIVDTAVAAGADFSLVSGLTVKNIETINVTTNGAIGTAAGTAFDVSTIAGVTKFVGAAAGAGTAAGSNVKAAGTTDVQLTVSGNNTATVSGGKDVSVVSGATGTGATTIAGLATGTSSASVKGGGAVTVTGNSMKAVTLDGIAGATAAITSTGVTAVTVKNQTTALATTITNGTSTALTVNVDGAGYTTAGAAVAGVTVAAGATATSITLNATGAKSNVAVSGAAATTLNITGSAAVTLSAAIATATKIDGSASTGALTLGDLNAGTVTVSTGSGNDKLGVQATAATTVATGAGNDTVSLKSAIATGSKIDLGAGNDTLLAAGGGVSASTTTVIDGGEGTDSVSAQLITAGTASLFKNFELLNLDSTTGLDIALLTGNTITGLTMSGDSTTATYQNLTTSMGLTVDFVGDNSADVNTLSFTGVSGTADAYTITFAGVTTGTPVAANVKAGTIVTAGIETVNLVSGGTSAWNSVTLGANTSAKGVVITGAAKMDLTFAATFGTATTTTGVTSIDGSAATGALNINTTNVGANTGSTGLTVKGGSAADTITLAGKATVDAGAGNDTVVVSASGGTITTGAGTDTVNVKAAVTGSTTAPVITTITDFTVGSDKLGFTDIGTEVFTSTKVNIGTATALFAGTVNALDLAAASATGNVNAVVTWFQYAGDTYVVQDNSAATTFTTADIVVKLAGLVDLSTLVVADFSFS